MQEITFSQLVEINSMRHHSFLKFIFSKKATKIDDIVTVNLTLCSKYQIHGEDFVNLSGLLRKHELYAATVKLSVHILSIE